MKNYHTKTKMPSTEKLHQHKTAGKARFVDHRSVSAVQRRFIEGINSRKQTKTTQLQSAMKSGNQASLATFKGLANRIGARHGVDNSDMKVTFNSPFPRKVGAVATLQGNHAQFAPGQATVPNMEHEIRHRTDNKLNGTPKGDKVINGHRVDTTREKVVEQMA